MERKEGKKKEHEETLREAIKNRQTKENKLKHKTEQHQLKTPTT